MKNRLEFRKCFACYGLKSFGGYDKAFSHIQSAKNRGELSPKQYQRLKEELNELSIAKLNKEQPDLINELDTKIKTAFTCYR
jgi:hypothetical protein